MYIAGVLIVAALVVFWIVTRFYLRGVSLTRFDAPIPVSFDAEKPSAAMIGVNKYLKENFTMGERLSVKRERFDQGGLVRDFGCTFRSQVAVFDGVEVPGEWTLVEGYAPNKRLLYLHGGAFTVGSPLSHRPITANLAKKTGCAVFTPDYRLMPENPRMASIVDSRAAYQWLVENGPASSEPAEKIAVAGDSAGGNLTLCLSNWTRDNGVRLPDAVIGISPATDTSATSPSIRTNFDTDVMLKPLIAPLLKLPHWLLLWGSWKVNGIRPASKLISPVRDNLAGLPPTLIHASTAEMLYDDAKRYVNKATVQGSPVKIQSWPHMCHVWHIFDEMLPEANVALDEIAAFMCKHGVSNDVSKSTA
ncbi:alpha/beta hydrolase [Kordiimonas aquimaris]|uniref:alpha/beta hydrolase n=1 Tax=Kordiimonas aquimaris TaxID=707591 RepID=UPI0021D27773|nr:alpha/beta hydrolase [Kordiimonas aquimaris]